MGVEGAKPPVGERQIGLMAEFHGALGWAVWVYVIGHGGMGVLHQVMQGVSLSRMWSFKK